MNTGSIATRLSKIVVTGGLALWALLVTLGNLIDYDSNWAFVQHVVAMDTVFPGSTLRWRAITNPAIQTGAYLAIIGADALICLAVLVATIRTCAKLRAPKV